MFEQSPEGSELNEVKQFFLALEVVVHAGEGITRLTGDVPNGGLAVPLSGHQRRRDFEQTPELGLFVQASSGRCETWGTCLAFRRAWRVALGIFDHIVNSGRK